MLYRDRDSVRPTRLTLAPGCRRVFPDQPGPGTIVVTSGNGRLTVESGDSQPLTEGDVGVLAPGGFTIANACDRSELRVILLRQ
jgi:quercetin dioxygenase-like cupin family protein